MPLYELLDDIDLDAPTVILALDGWIDAGMGAQQAREALLDSLDTTVIATFDTDSLLDFRSRRPVMHLVDGMLSGVTWPTIELRVATDFDGNDLLLLVGAEPDHQWRAFAGDVVDLAARFGASLVVGLGAYPAPVPHTRPTRLAGSASEERLARFFPVRATIDVPTGVQGPIERMAAEAGVPSIGLWAQVPHYVATMPSPSASAALVDGLAAVADLSIPSDDLHRQAQALRGRLDELVSSNPEHAHMVEELERQWDAEEVGGVTDLDGVADLGGDGAGLDGPLGEAGRPLPSGDELAAELEQFLREQD